MSNNKYTPSDIKDELFSIPLYQRLFEWGEAQIVQLLKDLKISFDENKAQEYYVGIFTVYNKDNVYHLVDGQQRFTVLLLMAIAFRTENWEKFAKSKSLKYRLSFFARGNDQNYLHSQIDNIPSNSYINKKMENGINTINEFVDNIEDESVRLDFIEYIYKKTTFFISELPIDYSSQDLNKYFEAMNATGKGLENHEILKVTLLKKLNGNKEFYTDIWNVVSEMNKCLIRQKTWDNEKTNSFNKRNIDALASVRKPSNVEEIFKYCNYSKRNVDNNAFLSINDIEANPTPPTKLIRTSNERAILNFSEFLLQVLWLQLTEKKRKESADFFNSHKLLESFEKHLEDKDVEMFFNNLLGYRILFDYYIIRINSAGSHNISFFLNFKEENTEKDIINKLSQFQSMLYVSTSSHLWLTLILEYLKKKSSNIAASEYVLELKRIDNNRHKNDNPILKYNAIDRYWFWRLDYYLWEKRAVFFKDKSLEQIDLLSIFLHKIQKLIVKFILEKIQFICLEI